MTDFLADASTVSGVSVAVARPAVRYPRAAVKINGKEMPGWLSWGTEENSFYQADTFTLAFAVGELPAANGPAWWSSQSEIKVEIFQGQPPDPTSYTADDLLSVFLGRADDLDYDPVSGLIELHGRDMTALMLDAKTDEKFPNLTASKIVEKIAGRRGLTPKVKSTDTKVGKYYAEDNVRLLTEQTEWELLTWLAREEGFIVYVRGSELHFEPPAADDGDPYLIQFQPATATEPARCNTSTLSFTRALTVARSIKVTVKSWNAKQKRAFTRTSNKGKAASGGTPQEYSYTIPGLTADEAQKRADKLAAEISAHEMRLEFTGPASNALRISGKIKVDGTGTAFDQLYFPDSIARTMDANGGYGWRVGAKNHSPESEPSI